MEFGKLVPQILFDILTRFVPGAVLLCSWIVFLGQDDWRRLLDALLGGNLHDDNALPVSMLAVLFLSFLLGYLLAPFTRGVQRLNEAPPLVTKVTRRRWLANDPDAEASYDWLRAHQPAAGALCAKIRAEYTMYYALSATFLAVTVMAAVSGAFTWALASFLAVPLTAWRGAKIEETFQETARKFHSAYAGTQAWTDHDVSDPGVTLE
jgi:hypothetical protein